MNYLARFCVVLVLLLSNFPPVSAAGQSLGTTVQAGSGQRQGLWQTYTYQDGLPFASVQEILFDRQGRTWLGSHLGLAVFDGANFTHFSSADALADTDIRALLEDRAGRIWVGTAGSGLSFYHDDVFTSFTMTDGLVSNHIAQLLEDGSGHIWVGTEGGVSVYDGKEFRSFTAANGVADGSVSALMEDSSGRIWVGGREGELSVYEGGEFRPFTADDGLPASGITRLLEDGAGRIWVGTGEGLSIYENEEFRSFAGVEGSVSALLEDRAGRIWAGTWDGGLSVYEGQAFRRVTRYENPVSEPVYVLLEDEAGNLWVGSGSDGVAVYDGRRWTYFNIANGLAGNEIRELAIDRRGRVWAGTLSGGVSRYDGSAFRHFTTADGLPTSLVFDVLQTRLGDLWFGMRGGAARYDGSDFTFFSRADGLAGDRIVALMKDSKGRVWLGTEGLGEGVSVYDGVGFTNFTVAEGLAGNGVSALLEDSSGRIWIGTDGGLSVYADSSFTNYTTSDGLVSNYVAALLEDSSGRIWIGTRGEGLSVYADSRFTNYTIGDGLGRNLVSALLEDSSGRIWVGSDRGVSWYDGEGFHPIAADAFPSALVVNMLEDSAGALWFSVFGVGLVRYDGEVFQTLSRRDGLTDNGVHTLIEDRDGYFWLATDGGITRFELDKEPPQVAVTEVIGALTSSPADTVRLTSDQDFLLIGLQGRSMATPPEQMLYRYRLQGVDSDWQQTRQERVQYGALPVGQYTFEVQAVDRMLNYSESAVLPIVVDYPYERWAWMGGAGLGLLGFGLASWVAVQRRRAFLAEQRRRLQTQEALNQELERELQTASQLQQGLMPTVPPDIPGFELAGRCITANHVGGDFYQYFEGEDTLCVCLADVTGHDMHAAVPMMQFSGMLDAQMETGRSLEGLFDRLNRSLHRYLDARTFVCFTMIQIDLKTGAVQLVNAGCPPLLHYRAESQQVVEYELASFPLGVRAKAVFPVRQFQLAPGDRLLLCSDGLVERTNAQGDLFGFERLNEFVGQGCRDKLSAVGLIGRMEERGGIFAGDTPAEDDQTFVVVRVGGEDLV
ncbi:MAG: SpoIIE family protein phosphatase [Candidatus Latescibacteria bacterium]|nr:SpoIIE family protein phosphatase [Candidatus Latescibacterota bacterium]